MRAWRDHAWRGRRSRALRLTFAGDLGDEKGEKKPPHRPSVRGPGGVFIALPRGPAPGLNKAENPDENKPDRQSLAGDDGRRYYGRGERTDLHSSGTLALAGARVKSAPAALSGGDVDWTPNILWCTVIELRSMVASDRLASRGDDALDGSRGLRPHPEVVPATSLAHRPSEDLNPNSLTVHQRVTCFSPLFSTAYRVSHDCQIRTGVRSRCRAAGHGAAGACSAI